MSEKPFTLHKESIDPQIDYNLQEVAFHALSFFGDEIQTHKAIEEMAELIRALARGDDPANIMEEIADCYIMLAQLRQMWIPAKVDAFLNIKIQRLETRISLETRETQQ